jgi:hypothetical protein
VVVSINFYELIGDGGLDGARAKFERLVVAIAYVKHRAMSVAAKPGDWGIDAFAGRLDGVIAIWQAKYFIDGVGESQIKQIRSSFKSALKAADDHDHKVGTWTLCIPVDFDPESLTWWEGWKRRQEKQTGVTIDLWARTQLEALLLKPDCMHLARFFFPNSMGAGTAGASPETLPLPDHHDYDEALFVKQLEASEIAETQAAKQQFFNYEALARDVADKGDETEKNSLTTVEAEVRAIWETEFGAADHDPETGVDRGLVAKVMAEIRANHASSPATLPPMGFVHHMGTMHRVVENGEAGWVAHFRKIAEEYRA